MLHSFTIRQLQYFVAAAEMGSVTLAAEQFHVHQSSLSTALTELEKALGVQLFVRRRGQGVQLTATGKALLARARRLLRDSGEFALQADSLRSEMSGAVDIGCFNTIAPAVLPSLIGDFAELYPAVRLRVIEGGQDELVEALFEGRIEIAIMYGFGVPAGISKTLLYGPVPHALLPPRHALANRKSVALHELAEEPFILTDTVPARELITETFSEAGVRMNVVFSSANFDLVRALVHRGLGYSLISQPIGARPAHWRSDAVTVPLRDTLKLRSVVLAQVEGVQLTRRAATLRTAALQAFSGGGTR